MLGVMEMIMIMLAMIAMRLMPSTGLNGEKADYEKLKKPLVLIALVPDLDLLHNLISW